MKIEALIPFTIRDAETGDMLSIPCHGVVTIDDEVGGQLITDGLAKEFTLITPTGNKDITANAEYDVTQYASVTVDVPNPSTGKIEITGTAEVDVTAYASAQVVDANLIAENIKKDVTILGVTGSYEA